MLVPRGLRAADPAPTPATRLRVWRRRAALDRALASGIDPSQTPELQLRAGQLTDAAARRRAAAALEAVVDRAEACGPAPRPPLPLRTQAALYARAALLGLAQRLRDDEAVDVRAAAMTNELLESADSPLYTDSTGDSLWNLARRASQEIDVSRRSPAALAAR